MLPWICFILPFIVNLRASVVMFVYGKPDCPCRYVRFWPPLLFTLPYHIYWQVLCKLFLSLSFFLCVNLSFLHLCLMFVLPFPTLYCLWINFPFPFPAIYGRSRPFRPCQSSRLLSVAFITSLSLPFLSIPILSFCGVLVISNLILSCFSDQFRSFPCLVFTSIQILSFTGFMISCPYLSMWSAQILSFLRESRSFLSAVLISSSPFFLTTMLYSVTKFRQSECQMTYFYGSFLIFNQVW